MKCYTINIVLTNHSINYFGKNSVPIEILRNTFEDLHIS